MTESSKLTQREITKAMRELDRLERDEIHIVTEPIREKYRQLKNDLKDKCQHNFRLNLDVGVVPWYENYYCTCCGKHKCVLNEDVRESYVCAFPGMFEEDK